MTPVARIARLSSAFLASNLVRAAIGLGLSLALARALGAAGFGRWVLCTTWAASLTVVADLGFGVLLTRDGARPGAPAGRLVASALLLRLVFVVPLAALLWVGAGSISGDPQAATGLRLAALLGIVSAAYGCFGAMLRSQPRWLPAVLGMETGWLAVQLLGAWWIATRAGGADGPDRLVGPGGLIGSGVDGSSGSYGLLTLLMLLAIAVQLAQIVTALALWRRVFGDRAAHGGGAREPLVALMRRALPFAVSGIVANLQSRVGPLMLGSLSTQAELGLFAAASRFGPLARLAPQAILGGALPVLSHEHARDTAAARRTAQTVDRALLALALALAAGCVLLARPMLTLIYGAAFAAAAPSLIWVGIGLVPALGNAGRKIALFAAGGESLVVRWSVVALTVQAASAAALIPTMGSTGAAISVALGEAAVWWPLRRTVCPKADTTNEKPEGPITSSNAEFAEIAESGLSRGVLRCLR
jgi:O-antigen/teichoic acid export membrane protein